MKRRTYSYPDHLPDNSIRLLKIKYVTTINRNTVEPKLDSTVLNLSIGISVAPLNPGVEYRALSYAWDPKAKDGDIGAVSPCKSIRVNGELHDIDLNLFDALVQLGASYEDSAFWIDAICINQNDLLEKERLVKKMDDVYHNAAEVVIWLGKADQHSSEVIELMYQVAEHDRRAFSPALDCFTADHLKTLDMPTASSPIWSSYLDFYHRRWFTRGWVIQEVVLAREANCLCGPIKVPWNVIRSGSQVFLSEILRKEFSVTSRTFADDEMDGLPLGRNAWRIGSLQEYYKSWGSEPALVVEISTGTREILFAEYMLLFFVRMSRDFHWYDERDRVYSMIGLVNYLTKGRPVLANRGRIPPLTISPDYSEKATTARVLTNFARTIIQQSNSIGIVNLVSDLKYRDRACYRKLPSWVPTFYKAPNFSNDRDQLFHSDNNFRSGQPRFQISDNFLKAWGTQIGYLKAVQSVKIDSCPKNISCLRAIAKQSVLPRGFDRDEVLWRTLIWDTYGHSAPKDEHPAPPRLGLSFRNWVDSGNLRAVSVPTLQADLGFEYSSEIVTHLPGEVSGESCQLQLESVETTLESQYTALSSKCEVCDPAIFSSHARGVAWAQQLFSLSSGHLGMGPVSGRVGDELWILASCPFPMVLRRSGLEQNAYQVLGRSYVHGIMHGEAISEQSVWKTVTLI